MLQLENIRKSYTTGDFTQVALDDVSIAFRDNEFVAILGPSGSGKTTLLNIVGGLDKYDSGDLIIEGVHTAQYKDRDWDTYRNNRVGFVFQSYNLIPHQTILANVELALTLSGVSKSERRERALDALAMVGLENHVHKKPAQLSGGQMQRVAIARALINDPDILLADEPTGALDSKTSDQIMGLLKGIAADRLVVMVTHNPELAEEYATRIVNLRDGHVISDSDPFDPEAAVDGGAPRLRRTSMSFLTAISLSFNNLMTKKGRTLMTSFAGSIGIIGIALILALANGVNVYIKNVEEDTLSLYPITIQNQGMDFTSLMMASVEGSLGTNAEASDGYVTESPMVNRLFSSIGSNDLASLKEFLDSDGGNIDEYASSVEYSYDVTPQIFLPEGKPGYRQVNPDTFSSALGVDTSASNPFMSASPMSMNVFAEMAEDTSIIEQQYDVVAGSWPEDYDQVVVALTSTGSLPDYVLYTMGLRDPAELDEMIRDLISDKEIVIPEDTLEFTYDQILNVDFKVVPASSYYVYDKEFGVWTDKSKDKNFMKKLVDGAENLHISGIVQPKAGATATALQPGIYYTPGLTAHLIDEAAGTKIVKEQLAKPAVNVLTGRTFADEKDNPQRDDMDLSKLVTIDEEAIKSAFQFDESQLSLDPSMLELSMPGLSIDPSQLPTMDIADLAPSLDPQKIMAKIDMDSIMNSIDMEGILAGIEPTVDDEAMAKAMGELMEGFAVYCQGPGVTCTPITTEQDFAAYLATDEGKAAMAGLKGAFGDPSEAMGEVQAEIAQAQQKAVGLLVNQMVGAIESEMAASAGAMQAGLQSYMEEAMTAVATQVGSQIESVLSAQIGTAMEQVTEQLTEGMSSAMNIDPDAFAKAFKFNLSEEDLTQLMMSMMSGGESSFEGNLRQLGYADFAKPASIEIYPKDFESKQSIISVLDDYNTQMVDTDQEGKVITYTDMVGVLMSSVTTIINVVSYVLTAFVAISLVVSSIMIGVITYISVLERKKEIGILRSIGASKRDIRRVFNAETLIVGFVAGLLGIVVTLLLTIPINVVIYQLFDIANVAQLPWVAAIILIAISMGLTFVAGLIPSSAASRKDPVEALRSE